MRKRNIALTVAYDGTELGGWQRQRNARSVQAELEKALGVLHGHPVPVVGAGRTDAGVHARGQVANFYTDIARIPAGRFVPALNRLLPRDVRVMESREVDFDFHARWDARLRRYRYFIATGAAPDPFEQRRAWWLPRRPDSRRLDAMAASLLGEHDFTSLSAARDSSLSRHRYVHEAGFHWEGTRLVFQIAANAFLLRMVRSIVGSLVAWEAEGTGPERVVAAIAARDRAAGGPTAPSAGLFLWNVEYYASPTRPGRGDYWTRGGDEEAGQPGGGPASEGGDEEE
jgi:tRNA pseudouridine38-40 synthase